MFEVKTVSPGRGVAWLLEGFEYFKRSAGAWIGIGIIMLVITIISGILPFAGMVLQILMPVFTGGLILGCQQISNGGDLKINHLFAGFSQHAGNLLLLGVLYTLGLVLIMICMMVLFFIMVGGMEVMITVMEGDTRIITENYTNILLITLIGLAVYLPILIAVWFAPALIVLDGVAAIPAMKLSFIGCLKNIIPFLLYGIVGLPLSLLASIPLMLGWFIFGPMIIASLYIASRDIYIPKQVI